MSVNRIFSLLALLALVVAACLAPPESTLAADRLPTAATLPAPATGEGAAGYWRVAASELSRAIRRTRFASAGGKTEQFDWDITVLEAEEGLLTVVATDGRRLAIAEVAVKLVAGDHGGGTVVCGLTRDAGDAVLALLAGDTTAEVELGLSSSEISVIGNHGAGKAARFATTRPRYPNWRAVVPKAEENPQARINADALLAALVRAMPETRSEHGGNVALSISKNKLLLKPWPQSGAAGMASELTIEYDGDAKDAVLNAALLLPFTRVLSSTDTVVMSLRGPTEPLVFRAGEGYRFILMPVKK